MAERVRTGSEQDRKRINLESEREVRFWVKSLGVNEARLRELVGIHGHSATIIREVIERESAA